MKNFIVLAFVLFLLAGWGISLLLYNDNRNLKNQVEQRERLLRDSKTRDSIYSNKTKAYSEVITKYVSDSGVLINGRVLTTSQIVELWANEMKSKDSLYQAFILLQGNLKIIKSKYGIDYDLRYSHGKISYNDSSNKSVDSALMLLPYYRDKIKYDSSKKIWVITVIK